MPDTYDELTQDEKRQTLLNDLRVARERSASTLSQFAEPRGRFSTIEKASVVGVSPPSYPPMPENNPWRSDPVGPEPPLRIDINEMPPTGEPHEIAASITAQDVPSPERPAFSSARGNSGDPAAPSTKAPLGSMPAVGSPPFSDTDDELPPAA
jgi:hypothetical protein